MTSTGLILASASPRRRQLLSDLGLKPEVMPVDIDEKAYGEESAIRLVTRLAEAKAQRLFDLANSTTASDQNHPETQSRRLQIQTLLATLENPVVLAADTVVCCADQILGKPSSAFAATQMLQTLSGATHQVITGVHICDGSQGHGVEVVTDVTMRQIEPWEMNAYWRTGEPTDKAGGYGIQGIGSIFVTGIQGSYSNVVGLPLAETSQLLRRFGVEVLAGG